MKPAPLCRDGQLLVAWLDRRLHFKERGNGCVFGDA
jgi:hypothetical protein